MRCENGLMRRDNLNLKTVRSLVKFPIRGTRAQYIVDVTRFEIFSIG